MRAVKGSLAAPWVDRRGRGSREAESNLLLLVTERDDMAIHGSAVSMLKESLREYVYVADLCINFRKDMEWGNEQLGGCLGFPGATLMFCVVDTIGSYHRKRKGFKVRVDGSEREITNDSFHHFFILNSTYYDQRLSEEIIKKLYKNYRSLLLHNAMLASGHMLFRDKPEDPPFRVDDGKPHVNIAAFLRVTKSAVEKFLGQAEHIVPGSHQEKVTGLKR